MDKLGIDVKLLIAQLVNFGLFFFIFQKFIAKPFLGLIKSEEKKEKAKHAFEVEMSEQKEQAEQEEPAGKSKDKDDKVVDAEFKVEDDKK